MVTAEDCLVLIESVPAVNDISPHPNVKYFLRMIVFKIIYFTIHFLRNMHLKGTK